MLSVGAGKKMKHNWSEVKKKNKQLFKNLESVFSFNIGWDD
jgi:hypothetical protein